MMGGHRGLMQGMNWDRYRCKQSPPNLFQLPPLEGLFGLSNLFPRITPDILKAYPLEPLWSLRRAIVRMQETGSGVIRERHTGMPATEAAGVNAGAFGGMSMPAPSFTR
jgi:hypothetical protein